MNSRKVPTVMLALAAASSLALGCGDDCGEGYHLVNHLCTADATGGGAPGGAGGGAGTGGGDEAGAAGALACEPTFGEDCFASDECSCDATFCAGYPGEVGVCTRTGCTTDPSVCPSDWTCMDLSVYGLPSICTPPA